MDNKERIKRILNKLKAAKKQKLECFGSDSHQFKLNKCIKPAEIVRFEKEHGITLPEDYCDFLLYAGNGGAGPFYGIYKLDKWADFAMWSIDTIPADFLLKPSSFKPGKNKIDIEFSDDDRIWEQQHIDLYQGTIAIGTQGCTYSTLLVVSDKYKGHVIYADSDDSPPYMCREKSFLDWYERWLDELLSSYSLNNFGYGPGGREENFFRVIETSSDEEEIAEAFYAFSKLPGEPDSQTIQKILEYKDHDSDLIRETLHWLIWKKNIPYEDTHIEKLLSDRSAGVRKTAASLARQRNYIKFRPKLIDMLHTDPDKEVAERIYMEIFPPSGKDKDLIPISRQNVLLLLQSPYPSIRYWAACNNVFIEEDVNLLISLLEDKTVMLRAEAISRLTYLQARKAILAILDLLERERTKNTEEKVYDDRYVISRAMYFLGKTGNANCVTGLLRWIEQPDDELRLDAVAAIAAIGDERLIPIAQKMLKENKRPERCDIRFGYMSVANEYPIKELVKKELLKSPNPAIRKLV